MASLRYALALSCALLVSVGFFARTVPSAGATSTIGFEVPSLVDPIHTFGEPDVGVDPIGRVFSSGPTGTGTQRSVWFGSVDGGHTYRAISAGKPPDTINTTQPNPGGGDTDIAFDHTSKQYFTDLYALLCLRSATTTNGGATANESFFPGGCGGLPGADRQWLAVFDPTGPTISPYAGHKPLIYQEYNTVVNGTRWVKSDPDTDNVLPGSPGLNYVNAEQDAAGMATDTYVPFGADGYIAIDQYTGDVFQANYGNSNGTTSSILLNVGRPNAAGDLKFRDAPDVAHPTGQPGNLITVATGVPDNAGEAANFVVTSMDSARNLYVAWVGRGTDPSTRQVFVNVSPPGADNTWNHFASTPIQVSSPPSLVNIFPWVQGSQLNTESSSTTGAGRADVVWYGADKNVDPSVAGGQKWDVFMSQVVYPTDAATGAVTGGAPVVSQVKVTPHPMHYNDACLNGTGCIAVQGNRNLADYFQVKIDRSGAAEIVYDDTSNGLVQTPFNIDPTKTTDTADHPGAPLVTVARQSSGPGLYGTNVTGPSNSPVSGLNDPAGDALYPVIGGTNVPSMDIVGSHLNLSAGTLTVSLRVADLSNPAGAATIPGNTVPQFITRWQMGNDIYYAGLENASTGVPLAFAGKAETVDLCSVSACDPHVFKYPEVGANAHTETGAVTCPVNPSAANPCTATITIPVADVGSPTSSSLLEEVGTYAFSSNKPESSETNADAQADNVPLQIDGVCCYNFISGAPTATHVARFTATHARSHTVNFRWTLGTTSGVTAFNLYAGAYRLNTRPIPAHRGHAYSYTLRTERSGPYLLHVLYRNGSHTIMTAAG